MTPLIPGGVLSNLEPAAAIAGPHVASAGPDVASLGQALPTAQGAGASAVADVVMPGAPVVVLLLLAVVLLVGTASVTAAEAALTRVTRSGVHELHSSGHRAAERVRRLVERRELGLSALAFWRVLIAMLAAASVTLALGGLLATWWQVALTTVGACLIGVLVLAAAGPRRMGHRRPARVLAVLSGPTSALTAVAAGLARVGGSVARRRRRSAADIARESADELQRMVDRVSESEQLQDKERELLQSVFELGRTYVREVMVPRTDMVSIAADEPLGKALNLFTRSGYSRVPVYGETLDDLRGMLYLKDVMRRLHRRTDTEAVVCADVMREPAFVPETKLVDDLLREMQQQSVHIAMVVDEYGGTAGLVTIEDLLEELVGEMVDEHDRAESIAEDLGDGRWRVPARIPLGDLGALFDLEIDDDDVDTAGGLLAKAMGRVPLAGASVDVHGLHLEAERVEGRCRRVSAIVARRSESEDDDQ